MRTLLMFFESRRGDALSVKSAVRRGRV